MEKIIKKVTGKKSDIYSNLAYGIAALLAAFIIPVLLNGDTMFIILGIAFLPIAVISILRALGAMKMFVAVCEDKVYGVAGCPNMMFCKPFEISYSEITEVKRRNHIVTIQCRAQMYNVAIEDAEELCELIKKQMSASSTD